MNVHIIALAIITDVSHFLVILGASITFKVLLTCLIKRFKGKK